MAERHTQPESLLHRGLGHVEFFDLAPKQLEDLRPLLEDFAREGRESFSFHAPATRPAEFPFPGVTCFFLSEDEAKRELSFRLLEHTLEAARRWQAAYVVTHLTYGKTDTRDPEMAESLAVAACRRMAAMSAVNGVPLDIEFASYTDSFHRPDRFLEIVSRHAELGVCIDIGHAFLGAQLRQRDYLEDIAVLAPGARSLHLWNTTGPEHTRLHHHTPLHPSQRVAEGWLDVERIMAVVLGRNPEPHVVFEYPVEKLTPEIQAGYDWVADMVARIRRLPRHLDGPRAAELNEKPENRSIWKKNN